MVITDPSDLGRGKMFFVNVLLSAHAETVIDSEVYLAPSGDLF